MITFKAMVISTNRRRDGTYPVKIRVTFKGKSRRLPTTMVCKDRDLTRSLKIKSADILNKSEELIGQMRRAVMDISPFDLDNHDVDWVVAKIRRTLGGEAFTLDFFEWADRVIQGKTQETGGTYVTAVNSFASFLGKRSIDINSITKAMVLEYVEWVDKQPKMYYDRHTGEIKPTDKVRGSKRASVANVKMLSHIFVAARNRYNDEDEGKILIPRQPFASIPKDMPAPSHGQKNLGEELMQRIISYETDDPVARTALDVFILSFGLMGANMADLYNAVPFKGNTWKYNRQKTTDRRIDHAEMRVDVPDEMRPFIQRLAGIGPYWLNVLHDYSGTKDGCTHRINKHIKKWCAANEIPPFTFYAARHTWASLARKAGVEKATIDECLVHTGTFDMTDIYAERSWELMQEANRKVLELFRW